MAVIAAGGSGKVRNCGFAHPPRDVEDCTQGLHSNVKLEK